MKQSIASMILLLSGLPLSAATFELPQSKAELRGSAGRDPAIDSISAWEDEKTSVVWTIHVNRPGKVEVECLQAAEARSAGNGYDVVIGKEKTSSRVVDTGAWDRFQAVKVGQVNIPAPGEYEVAVVPHPKNTVAVMKTTCQRNSNLRAAPAISLVGLASARSRC